MFEYIRKIFQAPELRKRLLFTLGIIAVYRLGIFITVPGVNRIAMQKVVQQQAGTLLSLLNLFSGGALEQLSIFALNIMPYITASIIMSLMSVAVKSLEELRKEGEAGQRKINQYTRYGTIVIAVVQAFSIALYIESLNTSANVSVVPDPGMMFKITTVVTLTAGTAFLMWLGEQATDYGIGNGISIIIFAGIVASLPDQIFQLAVQTVQGQMKPVNTLLILFLVMAVVVFVVYFERAQRRIPIRYSRGKAAGGAESAPTAQSHLPFKVNMAGVIPPIFASSLLTFPVTLASYGVPGMEWLQTQVQPGEWSYTTIFFGLTFFFCFFYIAITFQPVNIADNLKKQGAFVPGIRPGKMTAEYIDQVIMRITVCGAAYVSLVCVAPTILGSGGLVPFYLGGTSLMIVVSVALDLVQQMESHLISSQYDSSKSANRGKLSARRS